VESVPVDAMGKRELGQHGGNGPVGLRVDAACRRVAGDAFRFRDHSLFERVCFRRCSSWCKELDRTRRGADSLFGSTRLQQWQSSVDQVIDTYERLEL
jgi:hypothetical protein